MLKVVIEPSAWLVTSSTTQSGLPMSANGAGTQPGLIADEISIARLWSALVKSGVWLRSLPQIDAIWLYFTERMTAFKRAGGSPKNAGDTLFWQEWSSRTRHIGGANVGGLQST